MVKFAKPEEKPFDPISNKLLSSIAQTPAPQPAEEAGPEAATPPTLSLVESPPAEAPQEKGPVEKAVPEKKSPERPKRAPEKRSALRKLTRKPPKGERLTKAVKCLFTPSEDRELRALVSRLSNEAGTSLTVSHLMRPYFDLLLHCEDELAQELRRADLSRPLNDKTALALFERELAEVIHTALRKASPLRADRQDSD